MWPYWLLFLVPASLAISQLKPIPPPILMTQSDRWPVVWWGMFLVLVLVIGWRHEVGGDWASYILNMELKRPQGFADPGFTFLYWLGRATGGDIYLVNLISASFFSWGLLDFCRTQPRPWLALTVAVPYLIIVVAMGYTRQSVGIGLSLIGIVALGRGNVFRFLFWVGLAAAFHKSAIIVAPIVFLVNTKNRVFILLLAGVVIYALYFLFMQEAIDHLIRHYIGDKYASSGAVVRVAMNILPAVLFLMYRKRFQLTREQLIMWKWVALSGLLLVVALNVSPSSTAIDRLALYWIPLQLFALSHLPNILGRRNGNNVLWVCVVVAYSALILSAWLYFGRFSHYWLPYQFYPWVWLWQ
jgi:hypothetical protein